MANKVVMTLLALIIAIFALPVALPILASAQGGLPGISQLEFDEPTGKVGRPPRRNVEVVDPADLLESGQIAVPPRNIGRKQRKANKKKKKKRTAKKKEVNLQSLEDPIYEQVEDLLDEGRFIIPFVKGPKVTEKDENSVLSDFSWTPQRTDFCDSPKDDANLCEKTKAVRSVLLKFTGNNDFYESRCHSPCKNKDRVRRLSDVLATNGQGDELRQELTENGEQCRLRIFRDSRNRWLVLQVRRLKCSCVPKSCATD